MTLPAGFAERMHGWLGPEWAELRDALGEAPVRGLRLHRLAPPAAASGPGGGPGPALAAAAPPLPVPPDLQRRLGPPVPWLPATGRYLGADVPAGRHVDHEAGAYYIQEPSALAAAAALAVRPGEMVLDLCAAPGGKAAALGAALHGSGALVCNEVHAGRARVLAQNLERLGVPALIVQEPPGRLAERWPGRFDAVLADAPCSGEGMFRKDAAALAEWSPERVAGCALRQRDILARAVALARPGGRVVYSTCTFNPIENEQVLAWALQALPVVAEALPSWPGWESGRPEWAGAAGGPARGAERARRLMPHRGRGEGAFVAALRVVRRAGQGAAASGGAEEGGGRPAAAPAPPGWPQWLESVVAGEPPPSWERPPERAGRLFAPAAAGLPLAGLRVLRPGLALAVRDAGGGLLPHHQLAMALAPRAARRPRELDPASALAYLAGQALPPGALRGTAWLHFGGLPLGWGRDVGQRTNNLYPKGLRRQDLVAQW